MVPPLLWRASCALAISLSACSDYDLNKVAEDPEDTGGPPELPTVDIEICREPPAASEIASPGLGWTDSSVCHAYSAPTYGAIGVRTLTSFSVAGLETSPTPPSNVRLVAQDNIDGSFDYPHEANFRSGNACSVASTDPACIDTVGSDWRLDVTDIGTMNSCFPDCVWAQAVVEFQDSTRTQNDTCDDYTPKVRVCMDFTEVMAARSEPIEAACSAGSGRFRLIPRRLLNKDGDSNYSVILTPIQVTGTGRLTGAAWITELDIVEDEGQTLRILKPNANFRFNSSDLLVDKAIVSMPLLAQNDWSTGIVSGGAPLIGEEFAGTTDLDFQVDLEWSCGTVPVQGERHPTQGYILNPTTLGCDGSWKQLFTVRPVPYLAPKHLILERYGHVEDRETIPLTTVQNGYSFDYRRGETRLSGRLSSYNGNGATFVLNEATVADVDVCDAGTYTLAPEQ